jgi:L-ascorbate metabolism protein UlaG (beta-lactamase superfamily)
MKKITYFGHACFELDWNGKSIVFDPFIRGNSLAKEVEIEKILPEILLLSHAHSDHTADAVEIAKQSGAECIAVFEICSWLQKQGVERCHPTNIGGKIQLDGITIVHTTAVHSSSFDDGSYGGVAGGFVIKSEGESIYFAGDTALFSDMKLISEMHQPQWAILPIGGNFTMDVEDAVKAAQLLGVKNVIGMHYDTFGYIVIDHQNAKDQFKSVGIELHLLNIGEEKILD